MASILDRLLGTSGMPGVQAFSEQGVAGTVLLGGWVQSSDRNALVRGQVRYRTFADMIANVSIIAAGVRYFLNLCSKPTWTCEPADKSDEAKKYSDFVEEAMSKLDTPWSRVIRRSATYRFYGFSVQEWIAKRWADGRIGFEDIESRPQFTIEKWSSDDRGSITGVWQRNPQNGQLLGLPRAKLFYLVDDTLTDNPDGMGLLRHLVEPAQRLNEYLEQEATGFLRDLRGIPVGRAPFTELQQAVKEGLLTQAQMDTAIDNLSKFVKLEKKAKDTALILSSQPYINRTDTGDIQTGTSKWGIDLITGAAPGLTDVGNAIRRTTHEIAYILGVEHLLLGYDGTGSLALSKDKSTQLYLMANSMMRDMALQADKDLIDTLWLLNNFPDEMKPKFKTEDVAFRDVEQISAVLRDMALAGAPVSPDDEVQNSVRDLLGMPHVNLDRLAAGNVPNITTGLTPQQQQQIDAATQPTQAELDAAAVSAQQQQNLSKTIAKIVKAKLDDEKRPGGSLSPDYNAKPKKERVRLNK